MTALLTPTKLNLRLPDAPRGMLRMASPLGRLEITSDGESITTLTIERDGMLPHDGEPDAPIEVLVRASEQLEEYFAGSRKRFALPLSAIGTPFQCAIWGALSAVPFGETRGYGELGAEAGLPGAARAVGGAVRANPLPLLIPCHRMLGSDRRLTGYSPCEGLPVKRWLLDHEEVDYADAA